MPIIGNPLNSVAFLTDSFNGNGSTTAFTMSVAPATSSSILVNITGVTQAPSTYSVVGTTLTFSTAPPSGTANIIVRYLGIPASGVTTTAYRTLTEFTATASQTTFTPPSYTVGFIAVYQNGVRLGSTDYTATNGTTVVLAVGALVDDLISTESFYVSSVLNALPVTGGTISGNLVVTGTETVGTIISPAALTLQTNNGTTAITVDTSQNVGIGTSSPAFKLDVNGRANISQSAVSNYEMLTLNQGYAGSASRLRFINTSGGNCDIEAVAGLASTMAFRTANTERMCIDSSGRVTTPYQPAFFAVPTAAFTTTAPGSYFSFNSLNGTFCSSNRSSGYNTTSLVYTAPVAGLYQFYISLYMNGTSISAQWFKNGSGMSFGDAALVIFQAASITNIVNGSVIIELAAGDYVGVQPRVGSATVGYYGGHSCFYGFLIG